MDKSGHSELWFDLGPLRSITSQLKTPHVIDSAVKLLSNMERVHFANVTLAPLLVGLAARIQNCIDRAAYEALLINPEKTEWPWQHHARTMELIREGQGEDMKTDAKGFWELAGPIWEAIMHQYLGTDIKNGLEAMREAMVITTWTSIESCLEALWDNTINLNPHASARSGEARRIVTLAIQKSGSHQKIRVLSSNGKERLKSIQVIREAYGRAFHFDSHAIDEALADGRLESLALVRNLLIHKCGEIDSDFLDRGVYFPTTSRLCASSSGKIHLEAIIAQSLVSDALAAMIEVLESVDEWLVRHP